MDFRKLTIPYVLTSLLCSPLYAQNLKRGGTVQSLPQYRTQPKEAGKKAIGLTGVIEQSLRANYDQNQRDYGKKILDLTWENTKDTFWMPQIRLNLNADPHRVGRLKGGNSGGGFQRIPDGTFGVDFGDYTVFNWGKDYLQYLNDKESYKRSSRYLVEQRRALRNEAIIKYFQLSYLNEVVKAYRRQLRHASFIYRYNREKVSLKKVSKQEYYQSRSEYLLAQNNFQQAANRLRVAEEEMAFLIADDPGTSYILKDDLNYERIQMPMSDALTIAAKNNPEILESTKDVRNAKRTYEIQQRENLPLPKFSVNLGAYTHTFGPGVNQTRYGNDVSGHNIDIVATLNATWSLTGDGGFLNSRPTEIKDILRQRSFSELAQAQHRAKSEIQRSYYRIKTYEQQIRILDASNTTNSKTFDVVLENYLNRNTAYINFQDALLESVASQVALAELYYLHTKEKVLLTQQMGVDEVPGKSFEQLGTPVGAGK